TIRQGKWQPVGWRHEFLQRQCLLALEEIQKERDPRLRQTPRQFGSLLSLRPQDSSRTNRNCRSEQTSEHRAPVHVASDRDSFISLPRLPLILPEEMSPHRAPVAALRRVAVQAPAPPQTRPPRPARFLRFALATAPSRVSPQPSR